MPPLNTVDHSCCMAYHDRGFLLLPRWVVFEHVLVIRWVQDSNVNGPRKLTLNVKRMPIAMFMFFFFAFFWSVGSLVG